MAIPTNFSLEVPQRAHGIICKFYDRSIGSEEMRLPSKATFLLSASMPIVIVPFERIKKYTSRTVHNKKLKGEINKIFKPRQKICKKDFFEQNLWQYVSCNERKGFQNLATKRLPSDIVKKLDLQKAKESAGELTTLNFFRNLRNALAHGGVLYLNEHGRSYHGDIVRGFVFVSRNDRENPAEFHILRIKMDDYRNFLKLWVAWMDKDPFNEIIAKI